MSVKTIHLLLTFLLITAPFAYTADFSQKAGSLEKIEQDIERDKRLKKRIVKEAEPGEEILEEDVPIEGERKIYIKKIEIRVTIFT